jgi:hypothetical protein
VNIPAVDGYEPFAVIYRKAGARAGAAADLDQFAARYVEEGGPHNDAVGKCVSPQHALCALDVVIAKKMIGEGRLFKQSGANQ